MKCITARIPYKYGETVRIKPLADIHYGASACDVRALKEFIDDDCYFLGLGDWFDAIVTTDIRYRKSSDDMEGEAILDYALNGLEQILEPIKERILVAGLGNHEDVLIRKAGTNLMERFCSRMNVPYAGYSYLLKIILSEDGARSRSVVIMCHHGWGGGSRTEGADITKYAKQVKNFKADCFLFGHVHKCQSHRIPRLEHGGDKLRDRDIWIGLCGTFLKTYTDSTDPTYSEIKGYPPVPIGGITLNIKPNHKWVKMWIEA